MIKEFFEYCLTPASFQARRSGGLYEAIAFESRARRNEKHWSPHWKICKGLVVDFLENNQGAEDLCIFGSGCLFEVPRDILSAKLKRLVLVDQVFPRSVRAWVQKQTFPIEMIECDLAQSFPRHLRSDLAISANLFSQLSLSRPREKKKIEEKHLQDLHSLRSPILLWTDVEKFFQNSQTQEILHREATVLTELKNPVKNWIWKLAPAPECHQDFDVHLEMRAHSL